MRLVTRKHTLDKRGHGDKSEDTENDQHEKDAVNNKLLFLDGKILVVAQGQLFVLEKVENGEIVCGAVLKEHDERWEDNPPAIYLRNFATRLDSKGVGILFMEYAEKYAVSCNKEFFRLDSADDNIPLAKYYEDLGFVPVGSCVDGAYSGILRQKKLK